MALDYSRLRYDHLREVELPPGIAVGDSGLAIVREDVSGKEGGKPGTDTAGEIPIGVSYVDALIGTRGIAWGEEYVVPAAAPYTVQLPHTNIVTAMYRIWRTDTGVDLVDTTDYTLALATGIITFVAGLAGVPVAISYSWMLTAAESMEMGYTPLPVAEEYLEKVPIMYGSCIIYTTSYDTSQAYAVDDPMYIEAGGLFSSDTGLNVTFGRCISVPTNADPYLGVAFTT